MNKPLTKYDCPFYISRGGHCEKTRFSIQGYMSQIYGCNHAKDISKCMWVKNSEKKVHFLMTNDMNRTIKFRGKVLHRKSLQKDGWVYGMPTIFRDGRAAAEATAETAEARRRAKGFSQKLTKGGEE